MNWRSILKRQMHNDRRYLGLFVWGAVGFFFGLGIVIGVDRLLLPSWQQEMTALAGLALASIGGLAALIGYIALSLFRILRISSPND
jgi:uncharacterized membrane protein YcjF (UPF0283 family)